MYHPLFHDRSDGGRRLAERVVDLRGRKDIIVLGLPRGGVVVASEVAKALDATMDVFIVRKLGVPGYDEVAMGAIASGGIRVLNQAVIREFGISRAQVAQVEAREQRELARREQQYRGGRPLPALENATVVLVDDGIATGATMAAAIAAVRQHHAARVIIAAPVIARDALATLANLADRCEYVATPEPFGGVGIWYEDFEQTTDAEVHRLLEVHDLAASPATTRDVRIPAGQTWLHGQLAVPPSPEALVVFAHGSGSSRFSPRNQAVARALNEAGYATLLFDLLTPEEERYDRESGAFRFDVAFLARRLVRAIDWLLTQPDVASLRVGLFGASTGAAAALIAAGARPTRIGGIVSRGGRPDLADEALSHVEAPTLLIVGADDPQVAVLNQAAQQRLRSTLSKLVIVPRAGHLFEERGAMEQVSRLAGEWFDQHLARKGVAARESMTPAGAT